METCILIKTATHRVRVGVSRPVEVRVLGRRGQVTKVEGVREGRRARDAKDEARRLGERIEVTLVSQVATRMCEHSIVV